MANIWWDIVSLIFWSRSRRDRNKLSRSCPPYNAAESMMSKSLDILTQLSHHTRNKVSVCIALSLSIIRIIMIRDHRWLCHISLRGFIESFNHRELWHLILSFNIKSYFKIDRFVFICYVCVSKMSYLSTKNNVLVFCPCCFLYHYIQVTLWVGLAHPVLVLIWITLTSN